MSKFIHWGCAAACSAATILPTLANTAIPEQKYPTVDVKDAPLEYRQFEKVEITGSAILAKEAKDALPLQVIGRRDIERSGVSNLIELLHQLPVMLNFQEQGTMTGTTDGGPEAAAIHGNQSGTLVLLNGQRLPFYGSQTIAGERAVVDLNFIPIMAIERIELLTDGASSRYGSDAVAGVVNIITKSSVSGLTVSAESTTPLQGRAMGKTFNLSWGKGKTERDGYSVQIHYSAQKQNALLAGDRKASREGTQAFAINGKPYWNAYLQQNFSLYSAPAQNVVDPAGQIRNAYLENNGRCAPGSYAMTHEGQTLCQFNTQPYYTLYPATEKQQLYIKGEKHLGHDWTGFSEVIFGQNSQISVPYGYNEYNNLLPDGSVALMTAVPLDVTRQTYANHQYHGVFGARGQIHGWDTSSSISTGQHRVDRSYFAGLLKRGSNLDELMLTPFETQQNPKEYSAETIGKFAPYVRPNYPVMMDSGYTQLQTFETLASKEIFESEHGPIALGLGLNTRSEKVMYDGLANQMRRPSFSGQRTTTALFAELQTPITAQLETTTGVRHDMYSDFGGITTGKLGWKWKASDPLFFRGSWGTGFRAPTLGQMTTKQSPITEFFDSSNNTTLPVYFAGNPNLKPERSQQMTLGFRLEPNKQWTLGMDYWRLDIADTFGNLSATQILNNAELRGQYLLSNENGPYISSPNLNLGHSRSAGIDYDAQWRQPIDGGVLRWSIKGTHFIQSKQQFSSEGAFESDLGRYSETTNTVTPRNQWTLRTVLDRGHWSVSASANYRSGNTETAMLTDLVGNTVNYVHSVHAFWTLDLASRWEVQKNLNLSFALNNVLDKEPPQRLLNTGVLQGVDTRYANYYGRTLKLKAEYKF